jgi:3-mercaptopyruvate sulfurtransferase SseA
MSATYLYFTLKYLGYDAAMYDGSFSQWSQTPSAPVVTGPNPK